MRHIDLIHIHKRLPQTRVECTLFSRSYGTVTKMHHIQGHKNCKGIKSCRVCSLNKTGLN